MRSKVEKSKKLTRGEIITILCTIITILFSLLPIPSATKIITGLSDLLEIPLLTTRLLILLTLFVILSLYLNLHYIAVSRHKLVKKYKNPPSKKSRSKKNKPKIEKPVILPPKVELLKILNFIDEKKSITMDTLIIELKYSNKIAKKYLKQLLKAEYIKVKPMYKSLIKSLFPFFDNSETKYIIDINGQQFLIDIKLINLKPPLVGIRS